MDLAKQLTIPFKEYCGKDIFTLFDNESLIKELEAIDYSIQKADFHKPLFGRNKMETENIKPGDMKQLFGCDSSHELVENAVLEICCDGFNTDTFVGISYDFEERPYSDCVALPQENLRPLAAHLIKLAEYFESLEKQDDTR